MAAAATVRAAEPGEPAEEPLNNGGEKLSYAQRKKQKQKLRKQAKKSDQDSGSTNGAESQTRTAASSKTSDVEVEYVSAPLALELGRSVGGNDGAEPTDQAALEENLGEYARIMERFGRAEDLFADGGGEEQSEAGTRDEAPSAPENEREAGNEVEMDDDDDDPGQSKSRRRRASRLKIVDLKQECRRPEVVEKWDVTATDPHLLVFLKAYRNTVPVPRHWSQKRAYLQGKRGLEKPPFELPSFIEATGISKMRQAYLDKAEQQKLKSKGRERMQPKMGKLDVDYQILHDAFFRHQTKPPLSGMGELYYEGKEFEGSHGHARPGHLSEAAREALGMPPGPTAAMPWLVNQQRYGPPPSYPSLKIPGLNAPIPRGAEFGYHAGGWGKPPVDERGQPLYGNVFGDPEYDGEEEEEGLARGPRWGEMLEEEEESEEEEIEEEESDGEEDRAEMEQGFASVASIAGAAGLETPAEIDLRKDEPPRAFHQVLEQRAADVLAVGLLGSEHTYVVPGAAAEAGRRGGVAALKRLEALKREMPTDLDVSLDPAELEGLDDQALRTLYEQRLAEKRALMGREDLSDLVASQAAQQKRKAIDRGDAKEGKKFKF